MGKLPATMLQNEHPQHSGFWFRCAGGSEHGNLICIHLSPPDEVFSSNGALLKSVPAFCLPVPFHSPAISSALGGKLDVHNDQMNPQIACLRLSSPGWWEGTVCGGS